MNCETCGQPLPRTKSWNHVTPRELDILSAWWYLHTVRATARFFGLAENTVKVHLMNARKRNDVHSTAALAQLFMGQLRTMEELMTSHNSAQSVAA